MLDKIAKEYLLQVLSYENVLCKNLFQICQFSKLTSKIYYDLEINQIDDFRKGGVSILINHTKYINEYLAENYQRQHCYLVFDEVMTNSYELWFGDRDYFILNHNEVYFFYDMDNSLYQYEEMINFSQQPWHLVGIVVENKLNISMPKIISEIDLLNKHLKEIIIGAFDGEGYIHYKLID